MSDWQPDLIQLENDIIDQDGEASPSNVLIYVDPVGISESGDQMKLLKKLDLARAWISENDPSGVPFNYLLLEKRRSRTD